MTPGFSIQPIRTQDIIPKNNTIQPSEYHYVASNFGPVGSLYILQDYQKDTNDPNNKENLSYTAYATKYMENKETRQIKNMKRNINELHQVSDKLQDKPNIFDKQQNQ